MGEKELNPKVSVLIPVYNVHDYVEHCLRSVFNNTIIEDCEIIIVNDCSTDDSEKIVTDLIQEYSHLNIQFLKHECNKGVAVTRNTAFSHAKGEYIICVDSDDWIENDYLEELYNKAKSEKCDIVGCDLFYECNNKSTIFTQELSNNNYESLKWVLSGKVKGWLWIKMINRDFIIQNNISWIEGLNLLEDLIFSTKVFYYAKKIGYVNKPLYHYNSRQGSLITSYMNMKSANQVVSAIEEIQNFLEANNQTELISELNPQKLKQKWALLFRSNKDVRKKYLQIWPETIESLKDYNTYYLVKIALKLSITNPILAKLLVEPLFYANLLRKKIISKLRKTTFK